MNEKKQPTTLQQEYDSLTPTQKAMLVAVTNMLEVIIMAMCEANTQAKKKGA